MIEEGELVNESGSSIRVEASAALPPGSRRNPSGWPERLIAIALASAGFAIALYLALYQWGIIRDVWEPFFGNGSYLVLHSGLSRLLPVPDAALGALGYAAEFITGLIGGGQRWRTLPWMPVVFGIVAIGMAVVSTILIICQPLIAHGWCTLCLGSATISFIVLGPAIRELRAGLQTLQERKNARQGQTEFRVQNISKPGMRMPRDYERIKRIQNALHEADWDALVCARASNVLLLTGYWPVIGTSIAVATREGKIGLIVPEDERELVTEGNVDELEVFKAGSLEEIVTPAEKASPALARLGRRFNIKRTSGFEHESRFEPTSYAGVHSYSGTLREILAATIPVNFVPADKILSRLRAAVTPIELARIRLACCIADRAYATGATQLCPGLTEIEAAARFRALLSTLKVEHDEVERADGFAYCMSGPNAANAFAAYQRSGSRQIKRGDLLLVHCNSWADGYWTDITRTYCCGEPPPKARQMLEAVLAARQAALEMIRPGIKASQVDLVTRDVIKEHGFEKEFKHPTGHGVGFAAINHLARPRLHPASDEVLAPGMVFNVEPGVYVSGYGGVRHCDMVSVTETAAEVLTPFHAELSDLILKARS